jgi:hypothetical protein
VEAAEQGVMAETTEVEAQLAMVELLLLNLLILHSHLTAPEAHLQVGVGVGQAGAIEVLDLLKVEHLDRLAL